MTSSDFTSVAIVFLVMTGLVLIVVPAVWLDYRMKARRIQTAQGTQDASAVQGLWETARRMEERIGYLETVLDSEVPGWRNRSGIR